MMFGAAKRQEARSTRAGRLAGRLLGDVLIAVAVFFAATFMADQALGEAGTGLPGRPSSSCATKTSQRVGYVTGMQAGEMRVRAVRVMGVPDVCAGRTVRVVLRGQGGEVAQGQASVRPGTLLVTVDPLLTAASIIAVSVQVGGR